MIGAKASTTGSATTIGSSADGSALMTGAADGMIGMVDSAGVATGSASLTTCDDTGTGSPVPSASACEPASSMPSVPPSF